MTLDAGTSYFGFGASSTTQAAAAATAYNLFAWGKNSDGGQLGLGDVVNRSVPVQVGTLTTWSTATGGAMGGAAIKSDNTIWTWGDNAGGVLGLGDTAKRSSPVQVGGFITWASVSESYQNTLAVKTDGTLWAWGDNSFGQNAQGEANALDRSVPVQVGTLATWSQVAGGAYNNLLALKTDGTLWSWGKNNFGANGLGDAVNRSSPVQVGTLSTWSSLAGGGYGHFLVTKTDGTLWAWGKNNKGQLGQGDAGAAGSTYRSSPVQVGTLATWSAVAGVRQTSVAIKTDSTLWAWGDNAQGTVGSGDV